MVPYVADELMISISNLAKRKLPINSDRSVSGRSGAWILDQNDFPFFDKFIIFFQIELMGFKSISGKSINQFRFIHSENMTHQFSDTPIVSQLLENGESSPFEERFSGQ